jgi:hypothetical protein
MIQSTKWSFKAREWLSRPIPAAVSIKRTRKREARNDIEKRKINKHR